MVGLQSIHSGTEELSVDLMLLLIKPKCPVCVAARIALGISKVGWDYNDHVIYPSPPDLARSPNADKLRHHVVYKTLQHCKKTITQEILVADILHAVRSSLSAVPV